MAYCAICLEVDQSRHEAAATVGLLTGRREIIDQALDVLGAVDGEQHVVVSACPEHVVDVYRGRIEGVRMAWRLIGPEAVGLSRNVRAAASASRA